MLTAHISPPVQILNTSLLDLNSFRETLKTPNSKEPLKIQTKPPKNLQNPTNQPQKN